MKASRSDWFLYALGPNGPSPTVRHLLLTLWLIPQKKPSRDRLALAMNVQPKTARRRIRTAKKHGWLEEHDDCYEITVPEMP